MPEISVIVPVYKVEKYLEKCIDSILNQTFKNFELILIDDGSPDRCGEMCDEYAEKDDRIHVIHQENRGVSAARNAGIKKASGNYIIFIDSDDYLEKDMFQIMINVAKEKETDVVTCAINYWDEEGNSLRSDFIKEATYNNGQLMSALFGKPTPLGNGCCNKLFKFNKEKKALFQEGLAIAEDWIYLFDVFSVCNTGCQINDILYNVVERRGSATRNNKIETTYKRILSSQVLMDKAKNHSIVLEAEAADKFLDDCIRHVKQMEVEAKKVKTSIIHEKCKVRWLMLQTIIHSIYKKLLSKSKIRGYFVEMIKL